MAGMRGWLTRKQRSVHRPQPDGGTWAEALGSIAPLAPSLLSPPSGAAAHGRPV